MQKVLLLILDGFGIAGPSEGNAIYKANPKNLSNAALTFPHTQLRASGEAVGLPAHESGNTEVGHLNIGAGKVVYQSLPRINMSIADGSLFLNQELLKASEHVKKHHSKLHLIGLIGEQHVHSSIEHLFALLQFCKKESIDDVYIHAITDGRDSPPQGAELYFSQLDQKIQETGVGTIATIMGRYYAMDRDKRWSRIEKAYDTLVLGSSTMEQTWKTTLQNSYNKKIFDEFIEPTSLVKDGKPVALIEDNDAVIFFNFRIDRPRELTKAFVLSDFETHDSTDSYDPYETKYHKKHIHEEKPSQEPIFKRKKTLQNLFFVTMTEYDRGLPVHVAFPPKSVPFPLGRVLSEKGMRQLRISESEKERFVTFYFNGLRETSFTLEEDIIIPSPKVPTYDMQPEMSVFKITDTLLKHMYTRRYDCIVVNMANPDMLGHTGNMEAVVKAIHYIDECIGRIIRATLQLGYTTIITADHGNCEQMINPTTGGPSTEHTENNVPFICIHKDLQGVHTQLQTGILADIAPTILGILGIKVPQDMTGRNLLEDIGTKI